MVQNSRLSLVTVYILVVKFIWRIGITVNRLINSSEKQLYMGKAFQMARMMEGSLTSQL